MAALLVGTILYVVLHDEPGMGSRIWAFLIAPLTVGAIFTVLGST
jgi:hypothetical protein